MARIESQDWSMNDNRCVTHYDTGESREATRNGDGEITVVDYDHKGNPTVGDGGTGIFGGLSTAYRTNTR